MKRISSYPKLDGLNIRRAVGEFKMRPLLTALGVGIALLPLSAWAQTPTTPTAAPPAPTTAPAPTTTAPPSTAAPQTPGTVDPAARALVDNMVSAYKSLNSLSAKNVFMASDGVNPGTTTRSVIEVQRPNQISISTTASNGQVRQLIGSNAGFLAIGESAGKTYVKTPVPSNAPAIAIAFQHPIFRGTNNGLGVLPILLADPNAGTDILPAKSSLRIGLDEVVEGVPTDVVVADLQNTSTSGEVTKGTIKFSIGKQDHLLRRVELKGSNPRMQYEATETFNTVVANPTLSTSTFAPPPGYTEAKVAPKKKASNDDQMFDPRLKVGAKPLPFAGSDLAGKPVNLAQYKGKVVLIDFWATWCGPCVGEMPNVIANYKKFHAKGFEIVGVSLDEPGDRNKLVSFTTKMAMPWRQIYAGKGWESPLAKAYAVHAIPFSLLIGKDGTIAAVNPRGSALKPALTAALAK